MKLNELLEGVRVAEMHAQPETEIADIGYDSRKITPGMAFVAVEGYATDGHKYMASAVANGAVLVICQRKPEIDIPYVLAEDSRLALAQMSANLFGKPADKLKIVGVTGTNGKTTVTNLIKTVLERSTGKTVGLMGTNINYTGRNTYEAEHTTPESYDLQKLLAEMVDFGCEYAVMEVSSHSLATGRVAGITYECGVFTNLTQDHLDFHHTMEEYRDAKALLFAQSRRAVINIDDKYGDDIRTRAKCPVMTFSVKRDEADLVARDVKLKETKVEFCAVETGKIERVVLGIPGQFSVYNALATIACCESLGLSLHEIAGLLRECRGVKGRAEVIEGPTDFTVIIDYAVTPDALENILKTVRSFAKGRVVVLFGLGGARDKTKRPIMGRLAAELADFVIISSDNPRYEDPDEIIEEIAAGITGLKTPFKKIADRKEAVLWALDHSKPNDILVLAGKGHEDYQIIGDVKYHLDEHEIVTEYFAKK